MTNKLTNSKALEMAIALATTNGDSVLAEKLGKMKISVDKKNSSSGEKKPTATQIANVGIKDSILEILADSDRMTITEIVKVLPTENGEPLSNQKVSALVRQLVADGSVVRVEDKRKAYFSIA